MNTEIKTITVALVLLTGIFLNILPSVPGTNGTEGTQGQPGPGSMVILPSVDAQSDKNNPYSFHWWYKYKQFQNFDSDEQDDDKKVFKKKHSKQSNSNDNERLDKKLCANSGIWNGKKCIIKDPEEQAAYEDAVCDNPSDTQKYAKLCGGSSSAAAVKEDKKNTESTIVTVKPLSLIDDPNQNQKLLQKLQQSASKNNNPSFYKDKDFNEIPSIGSGLSNDEINKKFHAAEEPQESADRIMSYFDKSEHQEDNDDNSNDKDDTPRVSSDEASEQEEDAMKDDASDNDESDDENDSESDNESDNESDSDSSGDKDN